MSQSIKIRVTKSEYADWVERALNHGSDLAKEQQELKEFGPSLIYIAQATTFGADVLIEENTNSPKDRVPRTGHKITVHGWTEDDNTELEFILSGFGKRDQRPGDPVEVNVRQQYAIRNKRAEKQAVAGPTREKKQEYNLDELEDG